MIFRKGGNLPRNLSFIFQGNVIEIVSKFVYLGITFSTGGAFNETHKTLSWGPQGFWGSGEKGYLFSGSWGALLIILGELGSKHILLGI